MSEAKPLSRTARERNYLRNGRTRLTFRQQRRIRHKENRALREES